MKNNIIFKNIKYDLKWLVILDVLMNFKQVERIGILALRLDNYRKYDDNLKIFFVENINLVCNIFYYKIKNINYKAK